MSRILCNAQNYISNVFYLVASFVLHTLRNESNKNFN